MSKVILLGLGSIGTRHLKNIRALIPDCHIIGADPFAAPAPDVDLFYSSPELAIQQHRDADFAVVSSPDQSHAAQIAMLAHNRISFLCEKPVVVPEHLGTLSDTIASASASGLRCACNFQYRFHREMFRVRARASQKRLSFFARDNLVGRYGKNVLGAMLAHPIDTALWCLGPAKSVDIRTDGVFAEGRVVHNSGAISEYDFRMDTPGRVSKVMFPSGEISFGLDDSAYKKCLAAYVDFVKTGRRDYRTAGLEDGRAVVGVMFKCRMV